jgi:AcrR family transcriptional regulator
MGIQERKIRQKQQIKDSILDASWQLVKCDGWQALSIRKIAEAIEYSVPVIYDHFQNKEAILLEFTKTGFRLLNEALKTAADRNELPAEKIRLMAFTYWEFAFAHKEYYQLMYGLGMPGCETVRQIEELKTFTSLILEPIKKLIASGNCPETDPYLKLHTFWSMLHGLISINMMSKEVKEEEMNQLILKDFVNSFVGSMKG